MEPEDASSQHFPTIFPSYVFYNYLPFYARLFRVISSHQVSWPKVFMHFSFLPCVLHATAHLIHLGLFILITYGEACKSCSY